MTRRARAAAAWIGCVLALAPPGSAFAQTDSSGTAEISGTVVTTGTSPTPLARVLVTISGDSLKPSRTTITDDSGRFAFRRLPAGRFTIAATRPPYVKTAFGAKRPGRSGTPVEVAAGARISGVTIPLAHGAAIAGLVRDIGGDPAPGVRVVATPLDAEAEAIVGPFVTDERGIYRIFGLPPGSYVVRAAVGDRATTGLTQVSDAEMDEILARLGRRHSAAAGTGAAAFSAPASGAVRRETSAASATYGYAPIYYPGTPDPEQADVLVLGERDERGNVDFHLQLVQNATIEGRVSFPGGTLPAGTQVTMTRLGQRERAISALSTRAAARPDGGGSFQFTGVLPGKYRVLARAATASTATAAGASAVSPTQPPARPAEVFWAAADVTVGGGELTSLDLTLQPGLRLTGRVVFDAPARTPPDPAAVGLRLVDVAGTSLLNPAATVRSDATFAITGILPGTYAVEPSSGDKNWWPRSVVIDGRDVLDFPLEIGPGGDVTGAVATFTDRRTELSGTLHSASNAPAPDYFVVVFAADRAFWRPAARRVRFTRPSTDGRYTLRDLPAGDYLVAALTDLEPSDLGDVSFLERLVPAALPVRLNNGEKKTQDLTLAR